jgi:Trypsin-co-occurring domain 1
VTKLIQFEVEGGGEVLVAASTDVAAGPVYRGGASGLVEKANDTLQAAVAKVAPAAQAVIDSMHNLARRPDEVSVTFGLEMSGQAGAFIASASTTANFVVTLTWRAESRASLSDG